MPYFLCRLATEEGRVISQSFFSLSRNECKKHFETKGFCILAIKRDWKRIDILDVPFEKKIKSKDFIMFNQELVSLIKAGYPILKCIEIITSRIKNTRLKELLMTIGNDVRDGKSLSKAFSQCREKISTVYIAALMAGEQSGNLADTINSYIEYEKVISRTKQSIKRAVIYPALLLGLSFALLAVIMNFVIPRFSNFYTEFGAQLPAITSALVSLSLFFKKRFYVGLILFAVLVLVFILMGRKEKNQIRLDRLKMMIPYANKIWVEAAVALFSRTLWLLLKGGISLISAVSIASQAVPNKYLRKRMSNLAESIRHGESLSNSIDRAGFFASLALDMIRIGESSANLDGMLKEVAEVYDDRIQDKIDTFVSLFEPLIIIFMGLIVALMLLSVYIPIFNLIRVVR